MDRHEVDIGRQGDRPDDGRRGRRRGSGSIARVRAVAQAAILSTVERGTWRFAGARSALARVESVPIRRNSGNAEFIAAGESPEAVSRLVEPPS
jgi:hypothetical protein